ncbi:MAG TPA: DUF5916 domain-containing protein [Longimicrobiales bacterium]
MLLYALSLVMQQAAAPGAPTVEIPRVEDAAVAVDGVLDEPVWARAAVLTDFSQYEPVDGRPAEERTEVLVWYAPDAIHFGIRAYDSRPDAIRATVADRDNIDGDDHVVLYLDTFRDRRRAFFFGVNPLGIQSDGVRTEGGGGGGPGFGGSMDDSPDYWFQSKGRLTDEGYVVEVRIPFKSLRYPGDGPQAWGFQVERRIQRTGYTDTWTAARSGSASFLAQAGTLTGLRDLERGVVLEAQPFMTATANGAQTAAGTFERERLEPSFGTNVRVGFTNLSLDATVNPDFSQIEADAGQVTINERFALFFEEKRPFFLQGIELFSTPNRLVHTRRIVDPIGGAKLTGKFGRVAVAHLTAIDEAGVDDAIVNITRVRRDFGANSLAGVVYTDRTSLDGDDHNRVLAADVRHVFGGMYFLEAQLGGAWTRWNGVESSAPIWKVELDRTGRRYGFNYRVNVVGEDFITQAGFVNRTGIVDAHAFNRLSFYGAPGALVESVRLMLRPSRIWETGAVGAGDAIEGGETLDASFRLRGGWEIEAGVSRNFWTLDTADLPAPLATTRGDTIVPYAPLDDVSGVGFELRASTPAFPTFDAEIGLGHGRVAIFDEGSEGNGTELSAEVALRLDESVRLSLSNTFQHITRVRDGSRFARTIIPRARIEVQPSRAFFLRAIAEYRSERQDGLRDARTGTPLLLNGEPYPAVEADAVRLDLLASYEPTPGTVAFLGYGASLGTDDAFAFRRLERSSDGFFIKVAYRFRR